MRPPDLALHNLQLWVHGRQFPDSQDFWDGNWLRVTAHCGGNGASVDVSGSIIHLTELKEWRDETAVLLEKLAGMARLDCMEPQLAVTLRCESLGHIAMEVVITPDSSTQHHRFEFQIDQSYLPGFLQQCGAILRAYPIRGHRDD